MFMSGLLAAFVLLAVAAHGDASECPFSASDSIPRVELDRPILDAFQPVDSLMTDYESVKVEIEAALRDSQDFWPADFGNYGPFFVRLAWHCAGSYRRSDGRGGCDGARIRFDPEMSWDDNANLDQALLLLEPIKRKFGPSLSWGDLIILSGTVAIESMGGPVLGFCGGRVDEDNGFASLELGPTAEQEAVAPCPVNGNCTFPIGPTNIGAIYVNPEGPFGDPVPVGSAVDVRNSFANMGMNDSESVALTGGGHAFGRVHGACPDGPGLCGSGPLMGIGPNTFTSGFDGEWTLNPTTWTNDYFKNLLDYLWVPVDGPGGRVQWAPTNLPNNTDPLPDIIMLTSDIAFIEDPDYLPFIKMYAESLQGLENSFMNAWYKLTTQDMGPVTRCLGPDVPPAQPFQDPLPPGPTPDELPDFGAVAAAIRETIPESRELVAALAFQCASSFRATDNRGGCNGARIRFPPMSENPENAGVVEPALAVLQGVKDKFGDGLTWADLIVLAGYVANEEAGGLPDQPFCPGRADATEAATEIPVRDYYPSALVANRDNMRVMGLRPREFVALAGRLRSSGVGLEEVDTRMIGNEFFVKLLANTWVRVDGSDTVYMSVDDESVRIRDTDFALLEDFETRSIVQEYAEDEEFFRRVFASTWTKLMNADRFDGPLGNLCTTRD